MKKSEITVGGIYTNGRGRIRKVVAEGAEYALWDFMDKDFIRYETIHDGTRMNKTKGELHNCSRASFASWAKERTDIK